jgi:hypothetical protein
MAELTDYCLELPDLPSEQEWIEAVEQIDEGPERDAALVLARGSNLMADVTEEKVTSERLGWLSLCTKMLVALQSAISAAESHSEWLLEIISRSTTEWMLHAWVLNDSDFHQDFSRLRELSEKIVVLPSSQDHSLRETVDRLRAYAAWCLWSDLEYFTRRIDRRNMNEVWSPDPTVPVELTVSEEQREKLEQLFGKVEAGPDASELREGRKRIEAVLQEKIDRIRLWLSDPFLEPWYEKIKARPEGKSSLSFFALFGDESTIFKQLRKLGVPQAYSTYSSASMALHGGTLEQFILVGDSTISPKLSPDMDEVEKNFKLIISNCNIILVLLASIQQNILNRPELRG